MAKKPKKLEFSVEDEIWYTLTILVCLLVIGFLVSLSGCSSPNLMSAVKGTSYQYDLSMKVNGQQFSGVGVVPSAKSYDIKIESEDSVDLLTVTSCHRDFSAQAVISQGWFRSNRGYDYVYAPAPGLEDKGSCLVRVGMYSKSVGGQSGWGVLDFQDSDTTLPGENVCNGSDQKTAGVSICQTKVGLIQVMRFDVPVEVATDKLRSECVGQMSMDSSTWTYNMASGECVIQFREISEPHRKHRHTTVGYDQTFIRTGE